ncbi:hypothetical protein ACEPAH_1776 [Sanghuangporus vaninii]
MPNKASQDSARPRSEPVSYKSRIGLFAVAATLAAAYLVYNKTLGRFSYFDGIQSAKQCRAPLPQFIVKNPPPVDHPAFQSAASSLNRALDAWMSRGEIDSIAVSVVTSDTIIYEGYWGVLRANETDESKRGTVNRHSVYRLASISKLFTAMETLILRDRGVFNLDDSITSIFPDLSYTPDDDPMTLRQLLSHMSGLGRDWPPGSARGVWPESLNGSGPPGYNGLPFPDHEEFMKGISENHLVSPPYTFPSYSNTGYSLLGLANVAANKAIEGEQAPKTHADLLNRDIFSPLGLNATSFAVNEANKAHVAVASVESYETDIDFGDATNPAGGQMSSMADLVKTIQTLIDPSCPGALIRPYTIREWMRPMHSWWDDYSEVGGLWEISRIADSNRRTVKLYQKSGELAGHHTIVTINPSSSFGVIILTTGPSMQTIQLNELVFSHFQPAFDAITEELTRQNLAGKWVSSDRRCEVSIVIDSGSLFVSRYMINGTDVLKTIQPDGISRRAALWSTGGNEFRLAVSLPDTGCLYEWVALDQYAYDRGFRRLESSCSASDPVVRPTGVMYGILGPIKSASDFVESETVSFEKECVFEFSRDPHPETVHFFERRVLQVIAITVYDEGLINRVYFDCTTLLELEFDSLYTRHHDYICSVKCSKLIFWSSRYEKLVFIFYPAPSEQILMSSMSTRTTLLRLAVALLALFNALLTIRLLGRTASQNTSYSYIDDDFPPVLDVPGIDSALELVIEPTVHYQLNGSLADQEWGMLLPEPAVLTSYGTVFKKRRGRASVSYTSSIAPIMYANPFFALQILPWSQHRRER